MQQTLGEWKNILHSESTKTSVVKNRRIKIWYVWTRTALWFCWKILTGPDLLMSPVVPISLHWTFLTTFWNYTILKWGLVCSTEKDTIIYFFVNPRGDAFSQASYSNCISALFEKHFSNRLTTADLRKAVIAHSFSLPQSSDYSLRESFATLMKNSVPTQKRYWDKRPLAQKKSRAVNLLGSFASWSPDKDSVEIISD